MAQVTVEQMRNLIKRLDEARSLDEQIPKSYIDRLERAAQLLNELKSLPNMNWDDIATAEEIEKAEAVIYQKHELINDIEKHFQTCALTVRTGPAVKERKRQPKRDKGQLEYERQLAEITKAKKAELGLNLRGKLRDADKAKLDAAVEKELKRQKITPKA